MIAKERCRRHITKTLNALVKALEASLDGTDQEVSAALGSAKNELGFALEQHKAHLTSPEIRQAVEQRLRDGA